MSGNEASAIGSLRAINGGQQAYASSCAGGGYAIKLSDLAKAPAGSTQGFISPDLAADTTTKSGYLITVVQDPGAATVGTAASACNGGGQPYASYEATADPVTPGTTGTRYFATDTRGTIFFSNTATFSARGTKGDCMIPPDATAVAESMSRVFRRDLASAAERG